MADDPVRDYFRLQADMSYPGFREERWESPKVVALWPDPAERERALRALWDAAAEEHYREVMAMDGDPAANLLFVVQTRKWAVNDNQRLDDDPYDGASKRGSGKERGRGR